MLHAEMRPYSFDGIKGQDKVVKILQNDVLKGNIKGAYCFTGVRGTGKTTSARLMAMAINCEHPKEDGSPCMECEHCKSILSGTSLDVLELDAASNNSVDNVRDILQKVQYKPMAKKKVFILDECHMLSNAASNALLKVLEEPPKDVVFILCTTERHKVLPTIMSRCSCFTFERIKSEVIMNRLKEVCEIKGVEAEPAALALIAKAADGAMRDGLSILDKFISIGNVTADEVAEVLGLTPSAVTFEILKGIAKKDPSMAVNAIRSLNGASIQYAIEDIYSTLLDVVDFQNSGCKESIVGASDYVEQVIDLSFELSSERAFSILSSLRPVFGSTGNERLFVTTVLSIIYEESKIAELEERVTSLENSLAEIKENGIAVVSVNTEESAPESLPEEEAGENGAVDEENMSFEAVNGESVPVENSEQLYYNSEGNSTSDAAAVTDNTLVNEENSSGAEEQCDNTSDGFMKMDFPDGISFDEVLMQLANDTSDFDNSIADTEGLSEQTAENSTCADNKDNESIDEAFTESGFGFSDDLARLFGN